MSPIQKKKINYSPAKNSMGRNLSRFKEIKLKSIELIEKPYPSSRPDPYSMKTT